MRVPEWWVGLVVIASGFGCGASHAPEPDASVDAGRDAGEDARVEPGLDAGVDAWVPPPPTRCEDIPPGLQPEAVVVTESECWRHTRFPVSSDGNVTSVSLAVDAKGAMHAIYYRHFGDTEMRYVTNAAGSWQAETVNCLESNGGPISYSANGQIAIDQQDVVHVLASPLQAATLVLYSNIAGAWAHESLREYIGFGLDLLVDPLGDLHFLAGRFAVFDPSYEMAHVTRNGEGPWIDDSIHVGLYGGRWPKMAVAASGSVYFASENACPGDEAAAAACLANGSSGVEYSLDLATNEGGSWAMSTIASNLVGNTSVGLVTTPDDRLHVLYLDANREMVHGTRTGEEWAWERVPGAASYGYALRMAADSQGALHIAHIASQYLHYSTNLSGEWRSESVDDEVREVGTIVNAADITFLAYVREHEMVLAERTCP